MTQDKVLYFSRVAAERGWYHEVFKKLLKKLYRVKFKEDLSNAEEAKGNK